MIWKKKDICNEHHINNRTVIQFLSRKVVSSEKVTPIENGKIITVDNELVYSAIIQNIQPEYC